MVILRLCVTLGLCLASARAVTPIEKVITLLGDLKTGIEAEGKAEAVTYGKFACFCKDTTKSRSKSITEGQDKIDTTTADIGSQTATRNQKITNHGKEQQKVEDTTKKLAETTATYQKDKGTYQVTNADLTKAINSAKRALTSLKAKKSAALLDVSIKSDVRSCLDLAEALNVVQSGQHDILKSFLQVDPNDPSYKFHSDKILTIISDLKEDFQKQKDSVVAEWKKTDAAYKSEKTDMEGKIDTAKAQVTKLDGEISKLKGTIAKLRETLVNSQADLQDDSAYLSDLTARCEEKGKAWDQRTTTRNDEVTALTKALDILDKGAKENDKVNKRALLLTKATPAKAAVKVAVKSHSSFVQAGSKTRRFLSNVQSVQQSTATFLRKESSRLNSNVLASLADQIMADPFVKVKKLVQGLIERLLEESKNEATKKGFCDTELGKSYEDRKHRFADLNQLDSDIEELKAQKGSLESEIAELTSSVTDLKADLKKATDLRATEKTENADTIKKAKEGAVAVGEALVLLRDFYKSAAKETFFLQAAASPIDEAGKKDGGFDAAYTGNQDSSKAILGLLAVIKSDFERTTRKTGDAEDNAHAEFVTFERTSKADIAGKEQKVTLDKQDLETTKNAIAEGMTDMATAQSLLDSAIKNIEELKPTCIDTGMSYAERVQKREDEIKALTTALCKLDADKKESECQ